MDNHGLTEMTLAQLRELCKKHGLPITGNKLTLTSRLADAGVSAPSLEPGDTEIEEADEVFTSDDPELERTATAGEGPLPEADPTGYSPESVPLNGALEDEASGEPLAAAALEDAPAEEEAATAAAEDGRAPQDDLRSGLVEILDLEDADLPTDQGLLQIVAQRISSPPASEPEFAGDAEDPISAYRRGRREAIDQAVQEVIATTGRAGGTLVKRLKRVADVQA